jgi:hypothetical protein
MAADSECCAPFVTEALSEESASDLARGTAPAIRVWLLYMIAARGGGEVWRATWPGRSR